MANIVKNNISWKKTYWTTPKMMACQFAVNFTKTTAKPELSRHYYIWWNSFPLVNIEQSSISHYFIDVFIALACKNSSSAIPRRFCYDASIHCPIPEQFCLSFIPRVYRQWNQMPDDVFLSSFPTISISFSLDLNYMSYLPSRWIPQVSKFWHRKMSHFCNFLLMVF